MEIYVPIFIAGGITMVMSLAGVIFVHQSLGRWLQVNLRFLVSLSAGVFLFTSLHLIHESFELGRAANIETVPIIAGIIGFLVFLLSQKLVPESHHHHEDDGVHHHDKRGVHRMLVGDAIHNMGDGIILASAFLVDVRVGVATTIGVIIHEFLQEISEFFVLKGMGLTTKEALTRNIIVATTIFIGIFLGILAGEHQILQAFLLGFAGGGFLYIVFHDLMPYREYGQRGFWKHLVFFILGLVLVFGISRAFPHAHDEDDHDESGLHQNE